MNENEERFFEELKKVDTAALLSIIGRCIEILQGRQTRSPEIPEFLKERQ